MNRRPEVAADHHAARGDAFTIGVDRYTAAQLAEARQSLAHANSQKIGMPVPAWDQLSDHEQHMATLDASNWLAALSTLAPDWVWKLH